MARHWLVMVAGHDFKTTGDEAALAASKLHQPGILQSMIRADTHRGRGVTSGGKAKDTIGRDIYWQLPNDFRTVIEARNNGVPLIEQAPKASVTQSFMALAEALTSKEGSGEQQAKKSGGLGRFFGLSKT